MPKEPPIPQSSLAPLTLTSIPCVLDRNHPVRDGKLRQSGHGMDIQPAHDAFAMRFNGPDADAQPRGNLLIALSFRDQNQYFPLAAGQLGKRLFLAAAGDDLVQRGLRYFRA